MIVGHLLDMDEPQTITVDHIRQLLASVGPSPRLVLVEGVVAVRDEADGLEVVTRDDLVAEIGEQPDDATLERQAEALNVAARTLGG